MQRKLYFPIISEAYSYCLITALKAAHMATKAIKKRLVLRKILKRASASITDPLKKSQVRIAPKKTKDTKRRSTWIRPHIRAKHKFAAR